MFSGREIPAMGMSIGLERIIEVAEEFSLVSAPASVCDAIVIYHDDTFSYASEVARKLRADDFNVDLSLLGRKSFGDQLKYADRRGIPLAVLIGEDEAAAGMPRSKSWRAAEQETVPAAMLAAVLASIRDR